MLYIVVLVIIYAGNDLYALLFLYDFLNLFDNNNLELKI